MAGGAGTRFWPLSTEERPKQFLALTEQRTLLQLSYARARLVVDPERILVLTNAAYTSIVAEQLPELPSQNIIGEPSRRDTAAAVALAALLTEQRFGQRAVMALLTADHIIAPPEELRTALIEAAEGCQSGALYTLAIPPTYPATGFGYLHLGETLEGHHLPHRRVVCFKEKPSLDLAAEFLEEGSYFWNSGMFVWTTAAILKEFERYLPSHLATLRPVLQAHPRAISTADLASAFAQLQRISVDYAILEKAQDVRAVVPNFTWDDVGGWRAVASYLPEDDLGNRCRGTVHHEQARGNLVFLDNSEESLLLLGVEDLIVVRAGTKTLVARRDRIDDLKGAVDRMTSPEA